MKEQRVRTPKPGAEIYGPHLPLNTKIVNGKLCPIPPQACSGDEAKARMERVNAAPISPACFEVERWEGRGGSTGFSCDGHLLSGSKR
jgi:hypothetical protein